MFVSLSPFWHHSMSPPQNVQNFPFLPYFPRVMPSVGISPVFDHLHRGYIIQLSSIFFLSSLHPSSYQVSATKDSSCRGCVRAHWQSARKSARESEAKYQPIDLNSCPPHDG